MEIQLTCTYCDKKWRLHAYSDSKIESKCPKCGDTNIVVKELDKTRIDGYIGCPPFPEKTDKIELEDPSGFPYWFGGAD